MEITRPTAEINYKHKEIIYDKKARITCYNDSGTMANGEHTFIGAVATSDRSIPMNTPVFIQGYGIMKISDKTAKWVYEKYGLTFDIYDPNCSKKFGVKYLGYAIQERK